VAAAGHTDRSRCSRSCRRQERGPVVRWTSPHAAVISFLNDKPTSEVSARSHGCKLCARTRILRSVIERAMLHFGRLFKEDVDRVHVLRTKRQRRHARFIVLNLIGAPVGLHQPVLVGYCL